MYLTYDGHLDEIKEIINPTLFREEEFCSLVKYTNQHQIQSLAE